MPASGCARIIRRRDADDDAGIGVALVARILAHAVGHDAPRLGRGGHHRPARAHAEAVDRAAVAARDAPACNRPRPVSGCRRSGRTGCGRSAIADARCARRSRTAWPRYARPAHAAWRRCRGRCGRSPAPHGRRRYAPHRPAPRPAPAACRRRMRRCRYRSPGFRSDIRRPGPRSWRAYAPPSSPAGTCRYAACSRTGFPPARPRATNSVSTLRPKWCGSLIWLYSLPSEKVPAPPSPNCTLDSGFSTERRHKPQVSLVRSRTTLPRSRMIGRNPICARISAANSPHGPAPITTGRLARLAGALATKR